MQKMLRLTGLLCSSLLLFSTANARDVLLRPGAAGTTAPAASAPVVAASGSTQGMSTEERIARLERILESQGLVDMLLRLESLQNEVQALRGEIELHAHQLEEIKQRQRDLYVDIDRRLLNLERNGAGTAVAPAANTAAPAATRSATPATSGAGSQPAAQAATAAAPAANAEAEQQAYQKAFDQLRDLRYEQAVGAFRDFIGKYPTGRYAHIAQYWIGEANYAQRKYEQAIDDYRALLDNYPQSPKLAEAMLKIGYSQYELGKLNEAEATLNQLSKAYPGTTEAGQAQNLIQKIRLKR